MFLLGESRSKEKNLNKTPGPFPGASCLKAWIAATAAAVAGSAASSH